MVYHPPSMGSPKAQRWAGSPAGAQAHGPITAHLQPLLTWKYGHLNTSNDMLSCPGGQSPVMAQLGLLAKPCVGGGGLR